MTEPQSPFTPESNEPPPSSSSWLPFAFAALVGLAVIFVVRAKTRQFADVGEAHPSVGRRLTSIELSPLVRVSQPLSAHDLKNQVVLLNFWGPWCGPCRMEMPGLIELEKKYRGDPDFRLISVSCGLDTVYLSVDQLQQETEDFVEQLQIEFAVYSDVTLQTRQALLSTAGLDSFAYPTTVLLDRQQAIRGLWVGYTPGMEAEIDAVVTGVLARDSP